MDLERLQSQNLAVYNNFLKVRAESGATFRQYLTLIELYLAQSKSDDCPTHKQLRTLLKINGIKDFTKTVIKPLVNRGYVYAEQRKAFEAKDVFLTEKGSKLIEKVFGLS